MSQPINRIHINNSTNLSLNERFTAIQTYSTSNNSQTRPRLRRISNGNSGSAANKKFLQQLEKRHKIDTAMKLKRRSLKNGYNQRGNRRNKNVSALALRLSANGKVIKARSLANIPTMKADFVQPVAQTQRSNSNPNLVGRIGFPRGINRRRPSQIGISPQGGRRMRIQRQNNAGPLNGAAQNQRRGRSRSRNRSSLQRLNSVSNTSLNQQEPQQQRRRSRSRSRSRGGLNNMNRNNRSISGTRRNRSNSRTRGNRSASRARGNGSFRGRSRSVHSRLGVKRLIVRNTNFRGMNRFNRGGNRAFRGRGIARRGGNSINRTVNGTGGNNNVIKRQGRARSRSGVRNASAQRGRSRSRGRNNSANRGGNNPNRGGNSQNRRGQFNRRGRSRSRGRGGRGGISRGASNNSKREDIKKEDLDKELDQYMALSSIEGDL